MIEGFNEGMINFDNGMYRPRIGILERRLTKAGVVPSDFRLLISSSTSLSLLLRRGEDEDAVSSSGAGSQGLVFSISATAAARVKINNVAQLQ